MQYVATVTTCLYAVCGLVLSYCNNTIVYSMWTQHQQTGMQYVATVTTHSYAASGHCINTLVCNMWPL
jgi:hypothetical protein